MIQDFNIRHKSFIVFAIFSFILLIYNHLVYMYVHSANFLGILGLIFSPINIFIYLFYALAIIFLFKKKAWAWAIALVPSLFLFYQYIPLMVERSFMQDNVRVLEYFYYFFKELIIFAYCLINLVLDLIKTKKKVLDMILGAIFIIMTYLYLIMPVFTTMLFWSVKAIVECLIILVLYVGSIIFWYKKI